MFSGSPGKDGLCECEGCKLIFVGSPPSRTALAAERNKRFTGAWRGAHDSKVRGETEAAAEIMAGYFAHTQNRRAVLNAFDRNVLDAACGLGFRLREFQRYGWYVYGLDPSAEAAEYAQACFLDVRQGWIDEGASPDRTYDLVLFAGGFGGIPDPVEAIKRLQKILRPGGLVFVSIGGDPISATLFHYSGESLRRLFMENGFQVLEEGEAEGKPFAWFARKKDARAPKAKVAAEAETEMKPEKKVEPEAAAVVKEA